MPVGLEEHVGRVLGARYRLIAPIGAGASAVVFEAEDLTLRRRVAVKILHPALTGDARFRRRFRAEAHASAQMSHPHLVSVFDWSDAEANAEGTLQPAYLVTELLTGGSLRGLLDRGQKLSLSQALLIGLHAAEGLAHAHRRGLVHRDIKPANLLFDAEGRLRIADFGIARAIAEATWTEPDGALVGTVRYAAPEQASGAAVEGRSDVYSLAVTLIEAVTGEVPLTGSTALATLVARQGVDLVVPDELGPLAPILRDAGRCRPEDRLTAGQLTEALLRIAPSLPRPEPLVLAAMAPGHVGSECPDPDLAPLVDTDATVDLRSTPASDTARMKAVELPATEPGAADPVPEDPAARETPSRRRRLIVAMAAAVLMIGAAVGALWLFVDIPGITGPSTHTVGSFVGRPLVEIDDEIRANGWTIASTTTRADGFEAGTVVRQAPAPGTTLEEGTEISLVISEGYELRTVPVLEGLSLEAAMTNLTEAGLLMGTTTEEFSETVPENVVISASLPAGEVVEGEVAVDLVSSLGPAPRVLPDLIGQSKADAVAALDQAGLVANVVEEHSQTVAEGLVISLDPPAGVSVAKDSGVTVVVSLGLPFVEVPDVSGVSAVEAAEILADAGFDVVDTVGPPNAEVLATSPPAGEAVRQGADVVIFTRQ